MDNQGPEAQLAPGRDVFPFTLRPQAAFVPGAAGSLRPRPRKPSRRRNVIIAGLVVACTAGLVVAMTMLDWSGAHQSPIAAGILRVQIIGGGVPTGVDILALAALLTVLIRRPMPRRVIADAIGIGAGAIAAIIVLMVISATDALGVTLSATTTTWTVVGFAGIGLAIANLITSRGWRRVIAGGLAALVLVAGTIGINADFGLDPTIGALAGISTQKIITLPTTKRTPDPIPTILEGGALWANWAPPRDMPSTGTASQVVIPGTISGFRARPAGLYLPPAALVQNPPELPLVIMMMGQPGNPDPSFNAAVLDRFANKNHGLAPIVVVADQIGNPSVDPLCTNDTRYGNAETYITQDVVNWARTHLHILPDPAHWTIAGYSNGGECAVALGAQFPNIWANVLDISGEKYPGSDHAASTLATDFHGNRAAYEATWPINVLAKGNYPDSVGIFTVSTNDPLYLPQAKAIAAAATAAHWKTTYFEILNGGHVLGALNGGLAEGYDVLYPRLGLSQPTAN